MWGAQLQGAFLGGAQLQGANLSRAELQSARLPDAQLQNADLSGAELQGANLWHAQLQNAYLWRAQLQNASLELANVEGATLAFSDLTNSLYGPVSPPPSYVAGIRGLSTVRVRYDSLAQQTEVSGLVSLRELLKRVGYRDLEREATYSIEHARTRHALDLWAAQPARTAEAVFRLVAFEWPVAYGLHPGRALLVLLGLMLLLSVAYLPWVGRPGRRRRGAIYRVWPSERVIDDGGGVRVATYGDTPSRRRAERLEARSLPGRYFYSLWFSLLSAFHIGWRELSVGSWLSRLQPREYALRAQGWRGSFPACNR